MTTVEHTKDDMLATVNRDIAALEQAGNYSDEFWRLLSVEQELKGLYRRDSMGNKSIKKEYELRHSYDFSEYSSPVGRRFTKKNSHKRVRQRFGGKATIKKLLKQFFGKE